MKRLDETSVIRPFERYEASDDPWRRLDKFKALFQLRGLQLTISVPPLTALVSKVLSAIRLG
jgi:hypothetical protein